MNKKEFKELDREQMIIAFNQLKDDYSSLFDELEQEKEKNKKVNELQGYNIFDIFNMGKESSRQRIRFDWIEKDKIKELLENEIIDISGFRCIAVEDIENLLEGK